MEYRIEYIDHEGIWRSGEVVNQAGLDYRLSQYIKQFGEGNVTYHPAIDQLDYIEGEE